MSIIYARIIILLLFGVEILLIRLSWWKNDLNIFWSSYRLLSYVIFIELPRLLFVLTKDKDYIESINYPAFFIIINLFMDTLGMSLGYFSSTWWYDILMHTFFFPFTVAAFAYALISVYIQHNYLSLKNSRFMLYTVFMTAMFLLSLHEMCEALIDWISGTNAGTGATSITDTGKDLFFDSIGCLVFIFCIKVKWLPQIKLPSDRSV